MRGNGGFDVFEFFGVALESFELARFVFEDGLDDGADQAFAEGHHVVEIGVGGFGLEHPEFGEVAAGLGFFGAERRAEGVDLAEGHGGGFDVKLAALREIGLLIVDVIHFEKRGGAFAGRGREHGRIGERVALAVHVIARGAHWLRRGCAGWRPGAACESTSGGGRGENRRRVL